MKKEHSNLVILPAEQIPVVFGLEKEKRLKKVIDLITICDGKDLAEMLGVKKAHILHLAYTNQIPSMSIADKKLFNKLDVMKALKRRKNAKPPGNRRPRKKPAAGG